MRRSRFAATVDSYEGTKRASFSEALRFDLMAPATPDEMSLALWRVASLEHAPVLMAVTHLLILVACIAINPGFALTPQIMLPAVVAVGLDAVAAFAIRLRTRLDIEPQSVVRGLCAYFGASGLIWILLGAAIQAHTDRVAGTAATAMFAGSAVAVIAAISLPPLAVVTAVTSMIIALWFAKSLALGVGIAVLAPVTTIYSIVGARSIIETGRKRLSREALARKAQSFVDEFENTGRGWFWETNAEGTLSYVSPQLAEDFGCEPEALLGRQFTNLLSVDGEVDGGIQERKTLGFHLSARFPFSDVIVCPAGQGAVHWSLSGNPVFDERGRFLGFRGIGTDLTEQRRSEQEISRLAKFDSLTGLPNRAMMRQTLDEALRNAGYRQKACALFLVDLDRFKNVNDTLGHPVGDVLLRQVAERLTGVIGNHGQIGRLGGDEFQAVLPGMSDVGVLESLARTLIDQISRPYMIEGNKVVIGASVGIAIGDPGRASADALVRNADLALYAAKAAGRGKHCLYEPAMHSKAAERQLMENDLRQAIERGELSIAYQPIVRAAGEEVTGFESLVRWTHPSLGPISPAKFIPLAEEAGLIGKIGEWVLRGALEEAACWPDHIRVAVNLSPLQFNDPHIVDIVGRHLAETGVRAERLELEITEGVFLAEGEATDETFARLKKLGVRLALDDFGTGYSSLGYLKNAPFDKIKIDQSFVRGAASTATRNAAIVRAIVTLAETLGMDSCAEGVETHDDLQLIRDLGVSMVQGYIFGQPASAEAARELANRSTVEAEGFQCNREARQRLMRRAIMAIGRQAVEVRLRNISSMGALVECPIGVAPGTELTMDIVGVGPVRAIVCWAHADRFGVRFGEAFDLGRLAPKREPQNPVKMLKPWYVGQREAG